MSTNPERTGLYQTYDIPSRDISVQDSIPQKKRRRPALACEQCRHRKVRCDRNMPCSTCVRGGISSCTYSHINTVGNRLGGKSSTSSRLAAGNGSTTRANQSSLGPTASEDIEPRRSLIGPDISFPYTNSGAALASGKSSTYVPQERTRHVDSKKLETRLSEKGSGDESDNERDHSIRGTVSKTMFFGQSHWKNGAEQFPFLRSLLFRAETEKGEFFQILNKCKALGRNLKEARSAPLSSTNLCKKIPDRALADSLLDAYLRTFELVYRILHVPSFRAEYDQYWQNPQCASEVFLTQLQLCMAIGATFHDAVFSLRAMATQWVYEAQMWLMLPPEKSRMTIAGLQVMCLSQIARHTCSVGHDLTWVPVGGLLRQALYMGLHRDPKHLAPMTVFRSEMRRRIWATILELNLQSSIDAGGVPLISTRDYDTLPPTNLDDFELSDDMDGSQFDRHSPSHVTNTSVQLAMFKSFPTRLASLQHINEFRSDASYNETLRLDRELCKACLAVSQNLSFMVRNKPASNQVPISFFQVNIAELLIYRFLLALHETRLSQAFTNPKFYYSRKICVDVGIKIAKLCLDSSPSSFTPLRDPVNITVTDSPLLDWTRIITCGSGMFRMISIQAVKILSLELIHQTEELQSGLCGLPNDSVTNEIRRILDEAQLLWENRIRAGETNVKVSCLFMSCLAYLDGLKMGLDSERMEQHLKDTALASVMKAYEILKDVAGGVSAVSTPEMRGIDVGLSEVNMDFLGLEGNFSGIWWLADMDLEGHGVLT